MPPRVTRHLYTKRDTILYALGVGAGQDASRSEDLRFVCEEGLLALPGMAVVLAFPGFWVNEPEYEIDGKRVLHAEQSLRLHAPLPVEGLVRGELTIDQVIDKGAAKGALLYSTRRVYDERSGALLASMRQTFILRGDGGRGGSAVDVPEPHEVPTGLADAQMAIRTRPEQALVYGLSGDRNLLHIDPSVAREAGFPRPILQGLCTFGVAARALLEPLCANTPTRMKRVDCRFTAPAYPGDTLMLSLWREGPGRASFQVQAAERAVLVLDNGYVEFDEI